MTAHYTTNLHQSTKQQLHRGYSTLSPNSITAPAVQGASTHHNVLIKKRLPARGIVSSNPKRVERFLETALDLKLISNVQEHTNAGWGVSIFTCDYQNIQIFVASVPMGSAGSGFAFFEMFAAGAQAIIRYGSNDRQVTYDDLNTLVVVDQADNLVGLAHSSGCNDVTPETVLEASDQLVKVLDETISRQEELASRRMMCHNVEDYHAYNFSHLFAEEQQQEAIHQQIEKLEHKKNEQVSTTTTQQQQQQSTTTPDRWDAWDDETAELFWKAKQQQQDTNKKENDAETKLQDLYQQRHNNAPKQQQQQRLDCWDMETAALFWRAQQFGAHAATVLQNLYKKPGTSPYEGKHGEISLALEPTFYKVILETLVQFQAKSVVEEELPETKSEQERASLSIMDGPQRRSFRRLASNDFIGVEEPLVPLMTKSEAAIQLPLLTNGERHPGPSGPRKRPVSAVVVEDDETTTTDDEEGSLSEEEQSLTQ